MKNIFSVPSIFVSCCLAIAIVGINKEIATYYISTDGKGRALFGIAETLRFGYQYYLSVFIILSIAFSSVAWRKKENKSFIVISFVCIIVVATLLFSRIWRLMLWK